MTSTTVDRFGTAPAPGSLALVHGVLNTTATPFKPDLLVDLDTAQAWLDDAIAGVGPGDEGADAPSLTARDLTGLRALRATLQEAVSRESDPPDGGTALEAPIDVALGADGSVTASARGRGALPWLRSAVMVACLTAELTGIWERLKICANPDCSVAFYDRSRNRSGTWHDVHTCGNRINLRASRARRRGEA